jgi:hypothetical protein
VTTPNPVAAPIHYALTGIWTDYEHGGTADTPQPHTDPVTAALDLLEHTSAGERTALVHATRGDGTPTFHPYTADALLRDAHRALRRTEHGEPLTDPAPGPDEDVRPSRPPGQHPAGRRRAAPLLVAPAARHPGGMGTRRRRVGGRVRHCPGPRRPRRGHHRIP